MVKKEITIQSPSAKHNIQLNRPNIRLYNLLNPQGDLAAWQILRETPMNKYNKPKTFNKKGRLVEDKNKKWIWERGDVLAKHIVSRCRCLDGYTSATDESNVAPEMIARMAKKLCESPIEVQLQFTKDPSRQGLDEQIQYATIKAYLPNCKVEKIKNGKLTLNDGIWIHDDAASVANMEEARARSIDIVITMGDKKIYCFAKYADIVGGSQMSNVKESKNFNIEAKKYVDKNKDECMFATLLDGTFAESKITEYQQYIKGYEDRIQIGTTESIINWIKQLEMGYSLNFVETTPQNNPDYIEFFEFN